MNSRYSLPCIRRVWLVSLLLLGPLWLSAQIGYIYDPASTTVLDPNSDSYISASGGAIDTSIVPDESYDFEIPFIPMFHLSVEPPADLQGGNDCGKSEIVDNPTLPMHAGFWALLDPDGSPGNGDEALAYRIRIAKNITGAYGFSFLIDTDNKIGFTGPNADPNAVNGNPGFEIEVIYGTQGQGLASIMDVDGTTSGTTLSSYSGNSNSQRSWAGYTNCPANDPIFLDFWVPWDSLGILPTDTVRMIFATATSPNSALGGSASDIGGVNDGLFNDPDSIFVAITDSTPNFTFGGCGWAITQVGQEVSCYGDTDGWAWVDVWGGTPPVSYLWSTGETTDTVYNLGAGTYEIYVTSGGGCVDTVSVTVTQPDSLVAQADVLDSIMCFGDFNGRIAGYATGGTTPYTYLWSNGALSDTVANLGQDIYTLYVTDANGCTDSIVVDLSAPLTPLVVQVQNQNEILCYGDSIGGIDLLITGGTPPYSVLWNDGNTDSTRTGMVAGNYTVIVTDAHGCTDSLEMELTQPAMPVGGLTIAESPVSCFGGSDGVGIVVASGGRSPYTYLWSNGETSDTAIALPAGNHTVIVTDSVGCTDTLDLVITQPDSALAANAVMTASVSCFGGNDGVATVNITGGTVSYSILWNTGDTANSITVPAGTYSVVVTDSRGCVDSSSVTITQPASALTVSITDSVDVLCFGDADGSATATATGGTPPYDFEWSNGVTDTINPGLDGGTYTVIVTDANGCEDSATVTISEPTAALDATPAIIQTLLCNGDNNGSGYIDVVGGTAPYSILWSNGATNDTIDNLVAGTYTVTVTDANGCEDTTSITLTEPTALSLSATVDANVLCFGEATGAATITVTGGTTPYSYVWTSGQTTSVVTDLVAGTHTVVVTDANGCQDSIDVTITQPTAALVAGTSSAIGVTCLGDVDGSASATATGGTAPYTYSWSNGMTGQNISGLAGGDYILTVTDANGCTDIDTVTIFEADFELLVGAVDGNAITCFGGNDGVAYASATGGAPPYSYSWSNGMTGDTITGITAGTYTVTVTDSMGCTDAISVTVTEPAPLVQSITSTNVTCFGANDGTATASPTGGVAPYSYLWNTGSTAQSISSLSAGTYWVEVTDANGCQDVDTTIISTPSMPLAAIISKTDVNCLGAADGTATANGTGGVVPYSYLWSDGQTGQTATGLAPGVYSVIMTDNNGCQDSASVTITEPALALTATANLETAPSCAGFLDGVAYGTASGGTAPYTYTWNDGTVNDTVTGLGGGQIVLTVTDANGCQAVDTLDVPPPSVDLAVTASVIGQISCNGSSDGVLYGVATGGNPPYIISWSTGHVGDTLTGVSAGQYLVYVVDSNGCSSTGTITIGEPDPLVPATSVVNNVSCFNGADGSATASATGGTSPYTYVWGDGQTTATATGLNAGSHWVTVTDSNGCQAIDTVTITEPATAVDVAAVMDTSVSCVGGADGEATASGSGGTAPYTYLWDNGQNTATATGLSAGTYVVTITDSLGCQDTASVTITEPAQATDVSGVSVMGVTCFGSADGWATVTGSGGTAPYTYSWDNGQTGDSAFGLAAGTYVVTVTDSRGCTDTANIVVPGPSAALTATAIDAMTISCFGGSDGTAYATATGGYAPYTYSWGTGSTNDTITGLSIGTYTVTITDSMGCSTTASVTLTQPTQVSGSAFVVSAVSCLGGSDGSARATGNGGTPPYTYLWDNGETTDTAFALTAGSHSVTVTDSNGCTATASVIILEPSTAVNAGASALTQVLCFGDSSATARATASGGTSPYTYLWSHGQTTRTATGLWAGTHTVVVTDARGCQDSATVTISQPATAVDASASMTVMVSCFGGNNGQATAVGSGGTAPYSYLWSTGASGATATGLSSQWYTVTVTDANGCSDTARVFITQPSAPVSVSGVVVQNVTCFGGSDGIAFANVTGGTAPYTYSWSDGQTTDTAVGLVAGNYAVLVTDSLGCQDLVSVIITEPATDIFANAFPDQPTSCYNGADGSAYVVVTNGVAPFTYLWSDGQTTDTATGLSAGTISVIVTDALGCTADATVIIASPPQNLILTPTLLSHVSCIGGADGSANVFAQGGTPPYSYLWDNGETTATATMLAAGTHTVVVTDNLGCSDSTDITIGEPATAVDVTASVLFPVNCFGGSDGYATATATGGTPPYSYVWDDGQTGYTASNLDTGWYVVTVIDANGCQDTAHVFMTQPDSAVQISVDVLNNVRCLGGADGAALASAVGGTQPYSFDWDHAATTALAGNLTVGKYTVTVTDANGCQDSMSVWITQPTTALTLNVTMTQAVNCFGGTDGVAVATATGGDGPYTYNWSNGFVGDTATGLAAGSYSVTATDSNGCVVSAGVTITQPATALVASGVVNSMVSCLGGTDGSATGSATGGTAPYTFLWSDGQATATATNLSAGNYTVVITDANGCQDSATITITEPATAVSGSATIVNHVSCFGGNNGQAYITYSGGTGPYSVLWNTGSTSDTLSNLGAGTYTAQITDANNCIASVSVVITQPASALVASANVVSHVNCFGDATGTATASASGGTAPYSYSWSNGAITANLNGVIAGTYTVTVTDANGCFDTASVTITQPLAALDVTLSASVNVDCFGNTTGSITTATTGGTSPYSYAWSNGGTTANLSGLAAGTYSLTVTDANGCTDTLSVNITQPSAALTSTSTIVNHVSCFGGNNGEAYVTYTGGTAPYSVSWNGGQTTDTISNLVAGTYTATITDANGCTTSETVTITEPSSALAASASVTSHVNCFGDATGVASASATGGTAPYSYSWSNGATTATLNGVVAGTYTVTITDVNGCTDVASVTITQPLAALDVTLSSSVNVDCFGNTTGSITTATTGGTSPYSYAWSNGGTTANLSGLAAGTYSLTVIDANGCTDTLSVTITQPNAALTSTSTIVNHVSCFGGNNGEAYVTYTGGTAPYSVSWNGGQTTDTISNLVAGTYTAIITDANGCTTSETVTITEPSSALAASASVTSHVNCFGDAAGVASASATGGTAPYSYSWSNGATTATLNGVVAGTYTVTITDVNGCTDVASVTINQPSSALGISLLASQGVSCFGGSTGSAQVNATGGTTPYSYSWSNGATGATASGLAAGTYTATVTDANGCTDQISVTITQPASALSSASTIVSQVNCFGGNDGEAYVTYGGGTPPYAVLWNTGATTDTLSNLGAATYSVVITDANGCVTSQSVVITQPASALSANALAVNHVSCFSGNNGAANVNVSGGSTPYSYTWSNGASTASISNLAAGTYSVTVTDANGCSVMAGVTITEPTTALSVTTAVNNNVSCFSGSDGSATATPAGGTGPYSYSWSNGATTASVSNLPQGTHTVTVTDANGCTASGSVSITEPTNMVASMNNVQNVTCFGGSNGSVTVSVTGGTAPFSFDWGGGITSASRTGLTAGTYSVVVTDANGCQTTQSVTITQPTDIVITKVNYQNIACFGNNDGFAQISVTGGVSPYTISWSNGGSGLSIANISAGQYTATVVDANGCMDTAVFNITEPASALNASNGFIQNVSCFDGNDGIAYVQITGGSAPYSVNWSNGSTNDTISNLYAGNYTAVVTDANGCVDSTSVVITEPASAVSAVITVVDQVYCKGDATGSAYVDITGGVAPYTLSWSNGMGTDTIQGLIAGTYTLTVIDANGCSAVAQVAITEPNQALAANAGLLNPVYCYGEAEGAARVNVTGGTAPYSVSWDNGMSTDTISNLPVGVYRVTIIDAAGCMKTDSVVIDGPNAPLDNALDVVMVNCGGANSGAAEVFPMGGTPPYTVSWNHGAQGTVITQLPVGLYPYTITDANGCVIRDTAEVTENTPIQASVYMEPASCPSIYDGYIEINSTGGTPPYTYFLDGQPFSGMVGNVRPGAHELTISDAVGCDSTFYVMMEIEDEADYLHIPNAFTPNEDRINEQYKIFAGECIGPSRFQIFDRWGNLVFSSHDPFNVFWDGRRDDGTLVKEDVYVWRFTSADRDMQGHVVVIY